MSVPLSTDLERVRQALRDDGLLVEPAVMADGDAEPDLTLDEAADILSRGPGPSFSQNVDDERADP